MALIGNDFVPKLYPHTVRCGECGKKIPAGAEVLVSLRNGKVRKRVCSEECRQTFDDRFWTSVANKRKRR